VTPRRATAVEWGTLSGAGGSGSATMSDGVSDRITLTIPADGRFRAVPTLVLGGIGTRLDLPYERMDDLQLAILSLLEAVEGDEATVDVDADERGLEITVGPLRAGSAADAGLERVVSRLVDELIPQTRDGSDWIRLVVRRPESPSGDSGRAKEQRT
jgi:hypothetical protein